MTFFFWYQADNRWIYNSKKTCQIGLIAVKTQISLSAEQ